MQKHQKHLLHLSHDKVEITYCIFVLFGVDRIRLYHIKTTPIFRGGFLLSTIAIDRQSMERNPFKTENRINVQLQTTNDSLKFTQGSDLFPSVEPKQYSGAHYTEQMV